VTWLHRLSALRLLDALADIAYVVDLDGRIVAYTRLAWDEFALRNDASGLADPAGVLGRSLFDFISGEDTVQSYRAFAEVLRTGRRRVVTLPCACDAPDVRRPNRLAITAIREGTAPVGLLYQSAILEEASRPVLPVVGAPVATSDSDPARILAICSYCKRVRVPAGSPTGEWVTAEAYYARGGSSDVTLSHGICPGCRRDVVEPMLRAARGDR
jgi:hypothetical protein